MAERSLSQSTVNFPLGYISTGMSFELQTICYYLLLLIGSITGRDFLLLERL